MRASVTLAIAFFAVTSASHLQGKPDYYWRDYTGTVPRDALQVAQEGSDEVVYIGQGYFDGVGLLPGMVKNGVMELSVAAKGRVHTIKNNIKIMATHSSRPESDFQWITIAYQDLDGLIASDILSVPTGGSESGSTVYIGRHSEPNYTNIGKIYTLEPYQGLTIPNAEGKVTIYKNFEILTMLNFDCDENEVGNGPKESNGIL